MTDPRDGIETFVRSIGPGEHALMEFSRGEHREAAVRAFVEDGLRANERCLVIAHPESPEGMRRMLGTLDGMEAAVARGQLLIFPGKSFHESLGTPTRASMTDLHRKLVEEAQRDGFSGVRGVVDVTYYAAAGVAGGLERFEEAIGTTFPFRFRLLCVLDTRSLGAQEVPRGHHTLGRAIQVA